MVIAGAWSKCVAGLQPYIKFPYTNYLLENWRGFAAPCLLGAWPVASEPVHGTVHMP
jgi:hypothetical protein